MVEEIVNPIGSGDAMAAGIAWAIRGGRAMIDAVRIGIAAAQENLRRLDTGRVDPVRVQRLAEKVLFVPLT
jgi:fructose-1-phosphate kinase PfkB-like protein